MNECSAIGGPPDLTLLVGWCHVPFNGTPSSNKRLRASRSGIVRFRVGPTDEDTTGTLRVKTAGKVKILKRRRARVVTLGSKAFQALSGETANVKIRLSKAVQRLLRSKKLLRSRATVSMRDAKGNLTVKKYTFTITAPRRLGA